MKKITINDQRNLTMLMDFYELTMANGYYVNGLQDTQVVFDLFYRKNPDNGGYVVCAGLEQLIQYVQDLHFTSGDIAFLKEKHIFDEGFLSYLETFTFHGNIYAVPEGTIVYPDTPLVTVQASIIEAQLIETMLLLTINHQSLIATKASRIVYAAGDRPVMEFGARRAHGYDAANYGARAAYIGGVQSSATTSADQLFGVPAIGTMAHSWIQLFDSEYEAFLAYAQAYPDNCSLLVDTNDVLKSGIPNAIRVAKEFLEPNGYRLKGIRIDSGDLAYLSKASRKMLDEAFLQDCKIIVSNSIDEFLIRSLDSQGARIDSFGIGERLITSKSDPVFGGVYKLAAVYRNEEWIPRIKRSENVEKITNPGFKKLWRLYDKTTGYAKCDVLTLRDEVINESKSYYFIDPKRPWYQLESRNFTAVELQKTIFENGQLVYEIPAIEAVRSFVKEQLEQQTWIEERRFENPHIHYVNLSKKLYEVKLDLLSDMSKECE